MRAESTGPGGGHVCPSSARITFFSLIKVLFYPFSCKQNATQGCIQRQSSPQFCSSSHPKKTLNSSPQSPKTSNFPKNLPTHPVTPHLGFSHSPGRPFQGEISFEVWASNFHFISPKIEGSQPVLHNPPASVVYVVQRLKKEDIHFCLELNSC